MIPPETPSNQNPKLSLCHPGGLYFLHTIQWTANYLQFQVERNDGIEPATYPDCLALINAIEELVRAIAVWGCDWCDDAELTEKRQRIHDACLVIKKRHKNCA